MTQPTIAVDQDTQKLMAELAKFLVFALRWLNRRYVLGYRSVNLVE